jgi:hypothetical protein
MGVVQDDVLSPTLFNIFVQSRAKWNCPNVRRRHCNKIFLGRALQNDQQSSYEPGLVQTYWHLMLRKPISFYVNDSDSQQFVCLITTLCAMKMVLCKGQI